MIEMASKLSSTGWQPKAKIVLLKINAQPGASSA